MTLRLTDEETEALRRQAEVEGRSMQEVVRRAIDRYTEMHAHRERVTASSADGAERYRKALRILGEYLDMDDLLLIARDAVGGEIAVRDHG